MNLKENAVDARESRFRASRDEIYEYRTNMMNMPTNRKKTATLPLFRSCFQLFCSYTTFPSSLSSGPSAALRSYAQQEIVLLGQQPLSIRPSHHEVSWLLRFVSKRSQKHVSKERALSGKIGGWRVADKGNHWEFVLRI